MWFLIPLAGVAVAAIYALVTAEEREAGRRWSQKRDEVRRTIEEHRRNIESHLAQAKASYDFHLLTDLHFSSHQVGDAAYKLLDDSRTSLASISRMLVAAKEKREELKSQLNSEHNPARRRDLFKQIADINELRAGLFPNKDEIKAQRDGFLEEVSRLNMQTHQLKIAIRDRCGARGQDWYERLEARSRSRRSSRTA